MSTTWEKVLDDFNNRFGKFVIDFLEELTISRKM